MLSPFQLVGVTNTRDFVLGSDVTIKVQIVDKYTNEPHNVSGTTAATATFPNADGSTLTKTMAGGAISVLDAGGGLFTVHLSRTETPLLEPGDDQSWQFSFIDANAQQTVVVFDEQLSMVPAAF